MSEQDVPRETSAGVVVRGNLSPFAGPAEEVRDREMAAAVRVTEPGMATIGEVVEQAFGFGDPGNWPVCAGCGGKFPRLNDPGPGYAPICQGCATLQDQRRGLEEEVRRLAAGMDRNLARWMRRAGLSDREMRAELGRIPERVQRDLPAGIVASMTSGMVPANGFGLRGTAGTGKTFTVAALVQKMAEVRIASELPTLGRAAFRPWMAWIAWPEHVNRLRVLASREDGVADGDEIMERLAEVEVLVLDDLGAERWKAEDWVGSLLDLLVDARYKAERPTFYTTHLKAEEMQERYGARLWSRLTSDNPLISVAQGPDLRIVR